MDNSDSKNDLLEQIQKCGEVEMSIEETCQICEILEDEFLQNSDFQKAFKKGQLFSKFKIRQSIVKLAREGVPQMVKIYQDFTKTVLPEPETRLDDEFDDGLPDLPDQPGKDNEA